MPRPHTLLVFALVAAAGSLGVGLRAKAQDPRPQGWLGAALVPVQVTDKGSDRPLPGVLLRAVADGGPAEMAGLRSRDVILAIDGIAVAAPSEIVSRIQSLDPGAWVSVHVRRGRRELDLDVRLRARPEEVERLPWVRGRIGVEAIDLPPALREHFGTPREAGVMISAVEPGGPAESAGLSLGDVVFEADGDPVRSAGGFASQVGGSGVGNDLALRLMRDGAEITVEIPVEKAPRRSD
jgi:serine protease Do